MFRAAPIVFAGAGQREPIGRASSEPECPSSFARKCAACARVSRCGRLRGPPDTSGAVALRIVGVPPNAQWA